MANPITNEQNILELKRCLEALAIEVGNQFQRINTISSGNPEFNIDHLETTIKTDLVAAINSLVWVKNPQKIVSVSRAFNSIPDESDNCFDIIFRAPADIIMEIPDDLEDRFECGMYNEGPGNISFVAQSGVNLDTPDGIILPPKKVATLFKILDENNHVLKGELITP